MLTLSVDFSMTTGADAMLVTTGTADGHKFLLGQTTITIKIVEKLPQIFVRKPPQATLTTMGTEPSQRGDSLTEAEFVAHLTSAQMSIYAAILVLLPDRVLASDVLQKTNVTLWQKREEFVPGSNFLAWARSIARYHVLNERRKLGRERVIFDDALFKELVERQASRDEGATELQPQVSALRKCLEQLKPEQREMIQKRYAPDGSVEELAQQTGRSEAAVSQLLYRLREILRNCIEMRLAEVGT